MGGGDALYSLLIKVHDVVCRMNLRIRVNNHGLFVAVVVLRGRVG